MSDVKNTIHKQLQEEDLLPESTLNSVSHSIKLREAPVPEYLAHTTTAKNLGEYIAFESMGEMLTGIIINAQPVNQGTLEPSVYGRRMKTVYGAINCFVGSIALVTEKEVIFSYDPNLPYVEKARYTLEGASTPYWLEWNRVKGKFVSSGRKQFEVDARVRTSGIRLPQTLVNELDGLVNLVMSGHSVRIGLLEQENFSTWLKTLLTADGTVGDFLIERKERIASKNLNQVAWKNSQKPAQQAVAAQQGYGLAVVNDKRTSIEIVPDGEYDVRLPGNVKEKLYLDKSQPSTMAMMAQYAMMGGSFTTKK